jgi:hypothetical protein
MSDDVVAELDAMARPLTAGGEVRDLLRRARDEIVALRKYHERLGDVRAVALEEAAQVAEYLTNSVCVGRIRALKDRP